jgi:hypothetical protein
VDRDHNGRFLVASSLFIPNIASSAVAEAIEMREGLALANRLGFNNVVMESDSLETVEVCTGDESWWGESSATFVAMHNYGRYCSLSWSLPVFC